MELNISLDLIIQRMQKMISSRFVFAGLLALSGITIGIYHRLSYAAELMVEPVQACVIARDLELTPILRSQIAQCLGWEKEPAYSLCGGYYKAIDLTPLSGDEIRIMADKVSFYRQGRSELSGKVEVQQAGHVVNAQTAYVYRDAKTNQVTQIELLGQVRYLEAGRLMFAKKVTLNPTDKSGKIEDVLYRFNYNGRGAALPAWGRASLIERFANKDYLLKKATYTTCAPLESAWRLEAEQIVLDNTNAKGVARNARLLIHNIPFFYTPYFSFPTSKTRKSGFLMPIIGSTNVGGVDVAFPYYWNIAPNYDATLAPHYYSRRGLRWDGQFRYLTPNSSGTFDGSFLPHDKAFRRFLLENEFLHPQFTNKSADRWSLRLQNSTLLSPDLHLGFHVDQVSDDYFLQDFSSNLAILTQRQLLRQGDLTFTTEHWFFRGMLQSYQTLHPIDETPVDDVYQRLPQLRAFGAYDELPFNASFSLLSQFDYFQWPGPFLREDGARYHLNPTLSLPQIKPWGYITPAIDLVENYYDIKNQPWLIKPRYNRTIPRYSVDGGLFFERPTTVFHKAYTQTLEPRLYYLYVPFYDQMPIPIFDSGNMIFTMDQLFRPNRFSGFDRIGDTNQLSYALGSKWLDDETGLEKGSISLGQIRYFSMRRVELCHTFTAFCIEDPLSLGYLSPFAKYSPAVLRGTYHFRPLWVMAGDYAWDPATRATNNGHINLHYQQDPNKIIRLGYSYLVNGDITKVAYTNIQDNPLHQATIAYAWPFNEKWSTLGAYNYNISKRYEMMSFLGIQYDSCCFALRLMGGRTFRSLDNLAQPQYNNNVFFQILLKGLGSAGKGDPASRIITYIPGYIDKFHS